MILAGASSAQGKVELKTCGFILLSFELFQCAVEKLLKKPP